MLTYSHETLVMLTLNTTSIIIIAEILDVEQQSINQSINQSEMKNSNQSYSFLYWWNLRFNRGASGLSILQGSPEPEVNISIRVRPLSHLNWFWSFHSFNINTYMYMYIFTSSHSMYLTWSSSLVCMYPSLTGSFRITLYSQVPMV